MQRKKCQERVAMKDDKKQDRRSTKSNQQISLNNNKKSVKKRVKVRGIDRVTFKRSKVLM